MSLPARSAGARRRALAALVSMTTLAACATWTPVPEVPSEGVSTVRLTLESGHRIELADFVVSGDTLVTGRVADTDYWQHVPIDQVETVEVLDLEKDPLWAAFVVGGSVATVAWTLFMAGMWK